MNLVKELRNQKTLPENYAFTATVMALRFRNGKRPVESDEKKRNFSFSS